MTVFESLLLYIIMIVNSGVADLTSVSQRAAILNYFRNINALSPDTAVEMKDIDWLGLGLRVSNLRMQNFMNMFYPRYGIKQDETGKYWLDLPEYEIKAREYDISMDKKMKLFLIVGGFLLVGALILGFNDIFN